MEERKQRREKKRQQKVPAKAVPVNVSTQIPALPVSDAPLKAPSGPIAFVFPGQGSQAIGMLKVDHSVPSLLRRKSFS